MLRKMTGSPNDMIPREYLKRCKVGLVLVCMHLFIQASKQT